MLPAQILMRTLVFAIQVKPGSDPDCYLGHLVIRVSSCDPVSTFNAELYCSYNTTLGVMQTCS